MYITKCTLATISLRGGQDRAHSGRFKRPSSRQLINSEKQSVDHFSGIPVLTRIPFALASNSGNPGISTNTTVAQTHLQSPQRKNKETMAAADIQSSLATNRIEQRCRPRIFISALTNTTTTLNSRSTPPYHKRNDKHLTKPPKNLHNDRYISLTPPRLDRNNQTPQCARFQPSPKTKPPSLPPITLLPYTSPTPSAVHSNLASAAHLDLSRYPYQPRNSPLNDTTYHFSKLTPLNTSLHLTSPHSIITKNHRSHSTTNTIASRSTRRRHCSLCSSPLTKLLQKNIS